MPLLCRKPGRSESTTHPVEGTVGAAGAEGVEGVVGVRRIPESFRVLSALPTLDYADRFTLRTDAAASPEQWARAMFGDLPSPTERFIWRGLLGLRLSGGPSPATVAGWRIAGRGEDWIRLEAASWFLAGNLVVHSPGGRVALGTFLHYRRHPGRALWPPLSAVHRRLAPGLLRDAEARVLAVPRPDREGAQGV
ncbi:hypothetical protein [Streptomyces sp. NPDC047315]|uniref:hypothetical protein n=1 Tax=Streptomyces sp. NPDC047315 TaxID=3155142 RepID=UPI0033CF79DC